MDHTVTRFFSSMRDVAHPIRQYLGFTFNRNLSVWDIAMLVFVYDDPQPDAVRIRPAGWDVIITTGRPVTEKAQQTIEQYRIVGQRFIYEVDEAMLWNELERHQMRRWR